MFEKLRLRKPSVIFAVAVGLLAVNGVALANHGFSDVPNGAFYHDAVDYIADRDVTSGCNSVPNGYCPNKDVTRGQMAVFLQNAMQIAAPKLMSSFGPCLIFCAAGLDLDASPVVCQTADHTADYDQAVAVQATFQGTTASGVAESLSGVAYSTNSGASWAAMAPGGWRVFTDHTTSEHTSATDVGQRTIAAGTTIRFGVLVDRSSDDAGTTDLDQYWCNLTAQIFNQ